jgi:DNA-binding MarR family transcriptional regulator
MCMHQSALDLPCACTTLRKASRAVSRVYDASLAQAGMTTPQLAILRAILRRDGLALSRLAEELVMDRTSLYRALAPLIRMGWTEIRDGDSGRAKHVFRTDGGRQATAAAAVHWEAAQSRMVQALGADRWQGLSAALLAMADVGVALAP